MLTMTSSQSVARRVSPQTTSASALRCGRVFVLELDCVVGKSPSLAIVQAMAGRIQEGDGRQSKDAEAEHDCQEYLQDHASASGVLLS